MEWAAAQEARIPLVLLRGAFENTKYKLTKAFDTCSVR